MKSYVDSLNLKTRETPCRRIKKKNKREKKTFWRDGNECEAETKYMNGTLVPGQAGEEKKGWRT